MRSNFRQLMENSQNFRFVLVSPRGIQDFGKCRVLAILAACGLALSQENAEKIQNHLRGIRPNAPIVGRPLNVPVSTSASVVSRLLLLFCCYWTGYLHHHPARDWQHTSDEASVVHYLNLTSPSQSQPTTGISHLLSHLARLSRAHLPTVSSLFRLVIRHSRIL